MDEANKKFTLGGKEYKEGDWISLDGSTGNIYGERLHTAEAKISGESGSLHLGNLRVGDIQTAATVAHHGVELVEAVNGGPQGWLMSRRPSTR